MSDASVSWNLDVDRLQVTMANASEAALTALAHEIEGEVKVKIRGNDQVDTGFMLNSVYVTTRSSSGYAEASAAAGTRARSGKGRYVTARVKRRMAQPVSLVGRAVAAVAVGAEYAIWQELKKSFLFAGGQKGCAAAGGAVEGGYRAGL